MKQKGNSIITEKDILILKKLLEDGRQSSSSISKEIDLGREIINYRIKRLIKENLIVKFIPQINDKALHYQEYIILLKLNLDDEISKDEFIKKTIGNKFLIWTVKSESGWDLIVRLYAESLEEFKSKLSEILDLFSEVLTSYYTIISSEEIKEKEKEVLLKNLFDENPKKDFSVIKESSEENIHIDSKDKEILGILENDGRVQYKEIADKLSISSDTVKYRIEKMKEHNVIKKIIPVINFAKLGLHQYAGILSFNYLKEEENKIIIEHLKKMPQVIRAIKSLHIEEFFLTLLFEKENDIDEFEKEIKELFSKKIKLFEIFKIK